MLQPVTDKEASTSTYKNMTMVQAFPDQSHTLNQVRKQATGFTKILLRLKLKHKYILFSFKILPSQSV